MGMANCADCGGKITEDATTCPTCGRHQIPKGVKQAVEESWFIIRWVSYIIIVFLLILLCLQIPEGWGVVLLIFISLGVFAVVLNIRKAKGKES